MLGNLLVTCYDVVAMIFQLVANSSDTRLLAFPTNNITLLGRQDLNMIGPIDLVI
jgi:hypothetical protein